MGAAGKRRFSRTLAQEFSAGDSHLLDEETSQNYSPVEKLTRREPLEVKVHNTPQPAGAALQFETLSSLEYRLAQVESPTASVRERAREILYILKQLLWAETGFASLEDGGERFFQALYAEPWMRDFFERMFRSARSVMGGISGNGEGRFLSPALISQDIDIVLSWYIRRKRTLQKLFVPPQALELSGQIVEVDVFPDSSTGGVPAILVASSLYLGGALGQRLWLKAAVSTDHSFVNVRQGWETWCDQTQGALTSEDDIRFCAMQPLRAVLHEQIIENSKLYIPHEALDLTPGLHSLNIELELIDDRGVVLSSEVHPVLFRAARTHALSSENTDNLPESSPRFIRYSPWGTRPVKLPSPQSMGVWQQDLASHTEVLHYTVRKITRCLKGRSYECLRALLDLDLRGEVGQTFSIRFSLYQRDGREIALCEPSLENDNGVLLEKTLVLEQPVQRFHGVSLEIPSELLDLPAGSHVLLGEICVHSSDTRLVCGALRRMEVQIYPPAVKEEFSDAQSAFGLLQSTAHGVVSISDLVAELSTAEGEPEVCVRARIHSRRQEPEFFKVEVALELSPLEEEENSAGPSSSEVRVMEVIGMLVECGETRALSHAIPLSAFRRISREGSASLSGTLEVSVRSLDGTLLAIQKGSDLIEVPEEAWIASPGTRVEKKTVSLKDLEVRGDPLKKILSVDALIEFLAQPELWGGLVFMELLDRNGEPFAISTAAENDAAIENGKILPLTSYGEIAPAGLEGAMIQSSVQAEFDLSRALETQERRGLITGSFFTEYRLKILVFSKKGFLEATFERPLSLMTVSSSDDLLAPSPQKNSRTGWKGLLRGIFG